MKNAVILFDLIFYTHTPTKNEANGKKKKKQIWRKSRCIKKNKIMMKKVKMQSKIVKVKCIIVKTRIDIYT